MQISLLGVHMILLPWLQYFPQNLSIYHKYPLLTINQFVLDTMDEKNKLKVERLKKQLKGLINRFDTYILTNF
jgi:hypothetical protein